MYIEDRLFWRLEDILKVRQAKIEKQIPVWEAEWDLEESKVQAYYEAILKMVQSARGGALTDLKKARLASETQIKAVKDHLLAQKQRITPLKGIREQVCGLKQQLQTLLVQVEAPLRLNVRPLIQHTLPNVDLKNLQTSINLVNVRVATVHEVLVECYDDVHPAFNIDLVGIIDSYCQMVRTVFY